MLKLSLVKQSPNIMNLLWTLLWIPTGENSNKCFFKALNFVKIVQIHVSFWSVLGHFSHSVNQSLTSSTDATYIVVLLIFTETEYAKGVCLLYVITI